jgi:NADH:ubiquinone oxidoreductase subunit 3 (subunit A)
MRNPKSALLVILTLVVTFLFPNSITISDIGWISLFFVAVLTFFCLVKLFFRISQPETTRRRFLTRKRLLGRTVIL